MSVQESFVCCKKFGLLLIKHVDWFYTEKSLKLLHRFRNTYTRWILENKMSMKRSLSTNCLNCFKYLLLMFRPRWILLYVKILVIWKWKIIIMLFLSRKSCAAFSFYFCHIWWHSILNCFLCQIARCEHYYRRFETVNYQNSDYNT